MRALGSASRLPLVPAASSTAAPEAAWPTQAVWISGWTNCIVSQIAIIDVTEAPAERGPGPVVWVYGWTRCVVSYIAIIDVTEPPGELMYMVMARSGSLDSRAISWAITSLADASSRSEEHTSE